MKRKNSGGCGELDTFVADVSGCIDDMQDNLNRLMSTVEDFEDLQLGDDDDRCRLCRLELDVIGTKPVTVMLTTGSEVELCRFCAVAVTNAVRLLGKEVM